MIQDAMTEDPTTEDAMIEDGRVDDGRTDDGAVDDRWGAGVLDRDGHVTALALERYLHEPKAHGLRRTLDAHLSACGTCAGRLSAMEAMNATPLVVPPALLQRRTQAKVVQLRPRIFATAALAIAAVALVAVALPQALGGAAVDLDATDPAPMVQGPGAGSATGATGAVAASTGLRRKGGSFDVGFWVHDGARERAVASGDTVRAGERVGFRVWSATPGYLLIVGVDSSGPAYACHPQSGTAGLVAAAPEARTLASAVRFDAKPGLERLVALRCDAPFALADVRVALERAGHGADPKRQLPVLRPGCAQRQIVLRKVAAPAEPLR